jgi:CubicO group peptidase (beta-lactamase class C family)
MKRTLALLAFSAAFVSACSDDMMSAQNTPTSAANMPRASTPAASSTTNATSSDPTAKPATRTPLPRSTPEAEGVSSQGVLDLVSALDKQINEVHSIMLVRHGKVVAEGWWAPYTPGDMHIVYSVTKSFNVTAVGLAVNDGLINVDDPVLKYFSDIAPANPDPNLQAMTVKNMLTMATGHDADTIDRMRAAPDGKWVQAFLNLPVENPPGSKFVYNSGAAYMLGAIVQKVTGMTVEEYLTPRLFEPLGLDNRLWGISPEGINITDGGLAVTTEELAQFGLLYLNKGQWNGQQIVPESWVNDATSKEISNGNNDGNWNYGYGYQFWRSPVGFRADGSLGQYSFVLPDQDTVLAVTSGTDNNGGTNSLMNVVFQYLPKALQTDAPLPDDPAAHDALTAKLASLALNTPAAAATSPMTMNVSGSRYTMAANSQGITAFQLDFSGATPMLTIEDADGPHPLAIGIGQWVRGKTSYQKHVNELYDTPNQDISGIGAWTADNTFRAKFTFTDTPYSFTMVFAFDGDQVTVDSGYNVRWEPPSEPTMTGTRAATSN